MELKRTKPLTKTLKSIRVKKEEEDLKIYTLKELKGCLKERNKEFVHEYICNGWNATQAYIKIYPSVKNDNVAAANSSKLLTKTKIKQYIAFMKTDCEQLVGITKQKQLRAWQLISQSNIAHFHNSWIKLKDWNEILKENPDAMKAIESIETKIINTLNAFKEPVEVEYVKIKMYSKTAALTAIDNLMGYKAEETINIKMEQPLFPESE